VEGKDHGVNLDTISILP